MVPIMAWTDPEPLKITHWGLCTGFGSSGDWKVSSKYIRIISLDSSENVLYYNTWKYLGTWMYCRKPILK